MQGLGLRGWQGAGVGLTVGRLNSGILTNYLYKPGLAGGQIANGGTAAGDSLTLRPTAGAAGTGRVKVELSTQNQSFGVSMPGTAITSVTPASIRVGEGDTMDVGNTAAWRVLLADPTITYSSATPNNVPLQVFTFGPQITAPVNPIQIRGAGIFRDLPTFNMTLNTAHGSLSTPGRPWVSFRHQPIFTAKVGTETATYPTLKASAALATVGDGWTITDYLVHHIEVPGGTGVITNMVGLEIDDYGSRTATLALSLRSKGADVEMRHAGPAVFAANAAPTNVSVGLEVQSTTKALLVSRMTTAQKNALTALKGMIVYDTTLDTFEGFQGVGAGAWAAL